MKSVTFHLDDEYIEAFHQCLKDQDRSMRWLCNQAVKEYLEKHNYIER